MCGVKGRRLIVLFKLHSIRWFMKMSVWSLARQQSVFQQYDSEKIYRSLPTRWRWKASWHRNYVTVTLCIRGREGGGVRRDCLQPYVFCSSWADLSRSLTRTDLAKLPNSRHCISTKRGIKFLQLFYCCQISNFIDILKWHPSLHNNSNNNNPCLLIADARSNHNHRPTIH